MTENNDKINIVIHLVSGISYLAKEISVSEYEELLRILRTPSFSDFTLNNQWFNKSTVSSVYIEPQQQQSCEPQKECCQ